MERVTEKILPVKLEELKAHLHIMATDFDNDLLLKLKAAIYAAENFTNIVIWESIFSVTLPFSKTITIPLRPLIGIDGVWVDGEPYKDYTVSGNTITLNCNEGKEVTYEVVAGYENCPEDIKAAILLQAAKLFNNPVDSVETLPKMSQNLLHPYKIYNV